MSLGPRRPIPPFAVGRGGSHRGDREPAEGVTPTRDPAGEPDHGQPRPDNCYLIATSGAPLTQKTPPSGGFLRWAILGSNQ